MSQKTGKRSRKATDSPVVVIESNKETEDKPEIINTKNDITKKDSISSSTKTTNNTEETKEVKETTQKEIFQKDNIQKSPTPTKEKDSDTKEKSQTSIDIIESENKKKPDEIENKSSEQESLEGELLEPLVLEQTNGNGVQILNQPEEVIENGQENNEEKNKEKNEEKKGENKEEVKEVNKKEDTKQMEDKVVNGGESHEFEGFKNIEDSEVDGKKEYTFETTKMISLQEETFSQTLNDLSTRAVVGSDATRFGEEFEYSKFLSASKDQSLTDSIRHLAPRKSIRRTYYPGTGSLAQLDAGCKRKYYDSESLEDNKRIKKDSNSPGIMSYFGYPFIKKPDASSTPKLTSYKTTSVFDNDVSKIGDDLNTSNEKPPNKWCTVM